MRATASPTIMKISKIFLTLMLLPVLLCAEPTRIISLSPAVTREIYDLEAQDKLVGVTKYRPEIAKDKMVVGSLTELNFEQILALKPDLVIGAKDCNRQQDIKRLRELGLKVEVFEGPEDIETICSEFVRLGILLGKEPQASSICDDVRTEISRIATSKPEPRRVFWLLGSDPLVTVNDQTFSGLFIKHTGGVNIFGNSPTRYPRIGIEEVLAKNPEIIIIVDQMGSNTTFNDYQAIDAVRNKRVHHIDADKVCQPTPLSFLEGLRAVDKIMQN